MFTRRRFLRFASACGLALAVALAVPIHAQDTQPTLSGKALLEAPMRGGYVIYFRHADTDFSANDDNMTSLQDCTKQRNLTDMGRTHALAIGKALTDLKIPVGDVIASPYCRTRETAQLIFGRERVSSDVRGGPTGERSRYAALERLLSQPVSGAANRVIVSHGNPFAAVAGTPYLREGEAAIVEPLDAKGFRVVARVTWDAWGALAR